MTHIVRTGPRPATLADFLAHGAAEGLDSHPLLDTQFYAAQRADAAAALARGEPALLHYRTVGAPAGLDPHPLFRTRFYTAQAPDSLGAGSDPISHYLQTGWRDGLDPHPLFSTAYYLQRYPDIAAAGAQPLLHFLASGQHERRETSPFFDAKAYRARYPEHALTGLTPLFHYLLHGAARGHVAGPRATHCLAHNPAYNRPFGLLDYIAAETDSYFAWRRVARRLPPDWQARADAAVAAFRDRPPVSFLMHVTAETAAHTLASLHSLQAQPYKNWQLCAAIDPDIPPPTRDALAAAAAADPRLHLIRRGTTEESAAAANAALDAATGAYTGLLQPGDLLHPLALATLVAALQTDRRPALIYADEDILDPAGHHRDPTFKPGWSPDLLLGLDYLSRGSLTQTRLLRRAGGFRPGLDGAADYDLFLRLAPSLSPHDIAHIPRPLYSRLALPHPAAQRRHDGMHRALKSHTAALPTRATVARAGAPGQFSVAFEPAAGPDPLISIVIPTANARFAGPLGEETLIDNCVRSLREATAWTALEIIVVHDNNLTPGQTAALGAQGVVLIPYDRPTFNFSQKVNIGVRASRGEYVAILNDDVEAKRPDWLRHLLGWLQQPGVGVTGPKLFFADGRLQHTGVIIQGGNPGHLYYRADGNDPGDLHCNNIPRNWLAVTGACQLVRRTFWDQLGGYDESLPLNFNDVDFCLRAIEAGQRIVYVPQAELYHHEGVTKLVEIGNQHTTRYETDDFQARWRAKYPADPFYNPHLPAWQPLGLREPDDIRRTPSQARKLPAPARATPPGVNWIGPANRASGLGTASRSYLRALGAAGLATRLIPLDKLFGHQALVEHDIPNTRQDFPITMVHANADLTDAAFDHYGDELARARYRIGLWVWELPAARPEWQAAAARYDEIWVPSTFCQTAFKAITNTPVHILPYPLADLPAHNPAADTAATRAATRAAYDLPEDAFVFLYMFDTFSFVDRKNPQCLLDAFEAEFANNPGVILVLKISYFDNLTSNYSAGNGPLLFKLEDMAARLPNLRIITDILGTSDVHNLLAAADCYVSPHRSEGFGLTVAEAMHIGKPVIATDFGGTTDFVEAGVAFPLSYKITELAADRGPYAAGNVWADPSLSHLRDLMRELAANPALCAQTGAAAAAHMATRYCPAAIGRLARQRLRAIAARL